MTKATLKTAKKAKRSSKKSAASRKSSAKPSTASASRLKRGRFIVIDGIDGAGKATQTRLLVEALRKQGKKVETVDFPRYYDNFFGKLIGEALRGDYGDFIAIHPKIASVLYGCDRQESAKQINDWLDEGKIVIADRFTSSNQVHQGGKCKTDKERKDFLNWLDTMEHEILGVPRPDMIVYLSLPVAVSQALLNRSRTETEAKKLAHKKRYLKGGKDLAESNIVHMEDARQSAYSIIKLRNNWKMVDCCKNDAILPIDDIHQKVVKLVGSII